MTTSNNETNCTKISVTLLNDAISKMQHDISSGNFTTLPISDYPAIHLFPELIDKYDIYSDDQIASISHRSTYSNPYGDYVIDAPKAYLADFLEEYLMEVLNLVCTKLDEYRIKENNHDTTRN